MRPPGRTRPGNARMAASVTPLTFTPSSATTLAKCAARCRAAAETRRCRCRDHPWRTARAMFLARLVDALLAADAEGTAEELAQRAVSGADTLVEELGAGVLILEPDDIGVPVVLPGILFRVPCTVERIQRHIVPPSSFAGKIHGARASCAAGAATHSPGLCQLPETARVIHCVTAMSPSSLRHEHAPSSLRDEHVAFVTA